MDEQADRSCPPVQCRCELQATTLVGEELCRPGVRTRVQTCGFRPVGTRVWAGWVYKRQVPPPSPSSELLFPRPAPPRSHPIPSRPARPFIALSDLLAASKLEKAAATADEGDEIGIDPPPPETPEQRNKFLVLRLYEALNARDHAAVQSLLAPDLEWWFHGPPKHQHMMRLLTGSSGGFRFVPRSVDALGASTVIAEGHEGRCYWVHAWTVGPDGVITQLREYFNTDLTVTRLASAVAVAAKCVWQSSRPDSATNSLPGLLLAL